MRTSRHRAVIAGVTVTGGMLLATVFGGMARADSGNSTTGATVNGTNLPPEIECVWGLPDMDSSTAGIQYIAPYDDNSARPSPTPCTQVGASPQQSHTPGPLQFHVKPNAEDLPEERQVQLWAAVGHPAGLGNITGLVVKIYHPDGTFKLQRELVGTDFVPCRDPSLDKMFYAASNASGGTGQIDTGAISNSSGNGLRDLCVQGTKQFYHVEFPISKEQKCGTYRADVYALSAGAQDLTSIYFKVICFNHLVLDFTTVNWGPIVPGQTNNKAGDLDMSTPGSPTVKNTGNSGMGVGVLFGPMTIAGDPSSKVIDHFDAGFGTDVASLQKIDPVIAGVQTNFDDTLDGLENGRVLCSNRIGKLDLSIHPPLFLLNGNYTGTLTVVSRSVPKCSTDQDTLTPTVK